MTRTLAAAALTAAALATPSAAEPTTVVCRDVRVRLQYVVDVCLTYDLAPDGTTFAPTVTWDCTLRGEYPCGTGPVGAGRTGVGPDGTVWVDGTALTRP